MSMYHYCLRTADHRARTERDDEQEGNVEKDRDRSTASNELKVHHHHTRRIIGEEQVVGTVISMAAIIIVIIVIIVNS